MHEEFKVLRSFLLFQQGRKFLAKLHVPAVELIHFLYTLFGFVETVIVDQLPCAQVGKYIAILPDHFLFQCNNLPVEFRAVFHHTQIRIRIHVGKVRDQSFEHHDAI